MSRPQILHVIDSKKQSQDDNHHKNDNDIDNNKIVIKNDEKEFLEKVDSVRCYWSKLIQDKENFKNIDKNDEENEKIYNKNEQKNIDNIEITNENCIKDEINVMKKSSSTINLQKFSPTIEIVKLNGDKQATLVKAHNLDNSEFDHVRYKVIKSNLFRNNILTRSKKEAQFDGLIQYLQDYSFQELLTNNNVVIIEPVRTKIEKPSSLLTNSNKSKYKVNCKITGGSTETPTSSPAATSSSNKGIQTKHHFFYHPVRVNRELLEEELPNPDTVRNVRKFFEDYIPNVKKNHCENDDNRCKFNESNENNGKIESNCNGGDNNSNKRRLRYLTIDTSFDGNGTGNNINNNSCNLRKWDTASLSSGISSGDLSSPCECNEDGRVRVKDEIDNHNQHRHYHNHQQQRPIHQNNNQRNYVDGLYNSSEENICDQAGENIDDDDVDEACESYYVSEDVLEKIRECGSTITYYGGRILNNRSPELNSTAKAIIDEIHGKEYLTCNACQPNCCPDDKDLREKFGNNNKSMEGIQFKLVKSNSCSSRLELIGTDKNPSSDEPGVRELVNRLESGTINNTTVPRIIESQCIEKTGRNNELETLTINNQLIDDASVKDVSNTIALVDMIKQVTVNNHITVGPLKKSINPIISDHTKQRDNIIIATDELSDITKINNNKICRNRNVDLAFTMTQTPVTKFDSTTGIVKTNKKSEFLENLNSVGQKYLIAVKEAKENKDNDNKNNHKNIYPLGDDDGNQYDKNNENETSVIKKIDDFSIFEEPTIIKCNDNNIEQNFLVNKFNNNNNINKNVKDTSSSTSDGNSKSDRIHKTIFAMSNNNQGQQNTITNGQSKDIIYDRNMIKSGQLNDGIRTTSSRSSYSDISSINGGGSCGSIDNSIVKHYVANDKKIIEKRKYDDIEFEEFEIYDPNKINLDENNGNNNHQSNGYEKNSNGKSDDCYDSLDDKL